MHILFNSFPFCSPPKCSHPWYMHTIHTYAYIHTFSVCLVRRDNYLSVSVQLGSLRLRLHTQFSCWLFVSFWCWCPPSTLYFYIGKSAEDAPLQLWNAPHPIALSSVLRRHRPNYSLLLLLNPSLLLARWLFVAFLLR
jgi:hypothetical protein